MVEHPETPLDEMLEERDRFDKAILLGIVITSLLAALTALGQIHALQRHDESVAQADQWSSMASQASFTSNSIAQLQLDRFRLSQDASARSHQARTAYFLNAGPSLGGGGGGGGTAGGSPLAGFKGMSGALAAGAMNGNTFSMRD